MLTLAIPVADVGDEFLLWSQQVQPQLQLPENVLAIAMHGFTEMLNNALDHAACQQIDLSIQQDASQTVMTIADDGIGIFNKIRQHFGLDSDIHALMELVKGKLTSAPQAHSGEGLFFSSKLFDSFEMVSGRLQVLFEQGRCQIYTVPEIHGTRIRMTIANDSARSAQDVFSQYTDPDSFSFCKTQFYVALARFESALIARSQAKRLTARFENFSHVLLDFTGVDAIGQGFADEIARVWPLANPTTMLAIVHASDAVSQMLQHVRGRVDLPQATNLQWPYPQTDDN